VIVVDRRRFVQHLAGLGASVAGLVLLNGCGLVLPSAAQPARVPRVGFVGGSPDAPWVKPLWDALNELGWVEGQTLIVERRATPEDNQIAAAVAELVAAPVNVLVTVGTPSTLAAKLATETIPITFVNVRDPIGVGVVASLARPGGNVTGVSVRASTTLSGKRLELLRAVVPGLLLVAVISDAINPAANGLALAEIQQAAGVLTVQVQALDVGSADDLASTFATAANWPANGAIIGQSGLFLTERDRIADLAAGIHLPAMYMATEFVEAGGLMSYGTSQASSYRRVAIFVDKILRGANPADLPIEQLTTVEFAVNLKAAQALGLKIPPDVAAQVTEWVGAPGGAIATERR
jgi:putative ABC transport system substrate-binding protein